MKRFGCIEMQNCQPYCQTMSIAFAYNAHGTLGSVSAWARGGSFWSGFASGAVASFVSTSTGIMTAELPKVWQVSCMVAAGGLSGGVTSTMAGGDFWDGVCNGLICAGLNHAMHLACESLVGPDDPPENCEKTAWDLNGDGKLSKIEADHWWQTGRGKPISVDNSKIDWGNLVIPDGCKIGDLFPIETSDSYRVFPLETAMTYGGTSFEVIDINEVKVVDQLYHYDLRPWNSFENGIRNVATWLGMPLPSSVGVNYMIYYEHPNVIIK